ncbi:helix-turn-helix transcriptional regulator [Gryllotalpicola ginsengisoli]|uniref:helix-turn-helix transcriptional regulator n=1 Tax=Gryllotalpicola ginsengisoli TaxID=444608 RepID=UPI0003B66FB2|nr:WYL domain-containing protein [Gryllotalpicola ginsengisoli]
MSAAGPTRPAFAQDRLAFLLSFVPYLIDHPGVKVADAAAHFGVGEEELRAQVERITGLGVPGATATYGPEDLFDIDWDALDDADEIYLTNRVAIDDAPKFSAREAAALIAGLQYLQALPGRADGAAIATLMAKLSRGASATPPAVAIDRGVADAALGVIRAALDTGTRVEFDYLNSRGEHERRPVDPLRLESRDDTWYLRGWCHLRGDVRIFRVDRMQHPIATGEKVQHTPEDVALSETLFDPSADDLWVGLRIAESAIPTVAEYLTAESKLVPDGEGRVRTRIRVAHYHGLKRLVASLPGLLEVTDPPEARKAVADWAQAALDRYRSRGRA